MQAFKDNFRYGGEVLKPEMNIPDADMLFKLLLNGWVRFYQPVNDPMFSAHKARMNYDLANGVNYTSYLPDVGTVGRIQRSILILRSALQQW